MLTLRRYSIARSGLKNAALIARSISLRGKPIASICTIAVSLCGPISKADGSLNETPPAAGTVPAVPHGDGVAGGASVEVAAELGTGAAGAEGVEEATGAFSGVAGTGVDDADGAVVFGCDQLGSHLCNSPIVSHTFDTIHTMKPFSSMLYDSIVLES
jgi:putative intracellular protease/amidase